MKQFWLIIFSLTIINVHGANIRFSQLTSRDGISQSEIYSFLEDSQGFMWFGTVDGLNRYDGYTVEVFNIDLNNPHSLRNNTVRSLAEDNHGRIWIGTDNGLSFYDPITELIYNVNITDHSQKLSIWSLLVDENHLWIGTLNGVWRKPLVDDNSESTKWNAEKVTLFTYKKENDNFVRNIIKSSLGGVWIQTNNTLSRVVYSKDSEHLIIVNDEKILAQTDLIEDSSSNLWVASEQRGIFRYSPITGIISKISLQNNQFGSFSNKCSALTLDKNGAIWVGTLDRGVIKIDYDYNKNKVNSIASVQSEPGVVNSLNSNLIYSLYSTRNNVLWVGTIGSGVNIYNPDQKKFEHLMLYSECNDPIKSNFIRAVLMTDKNRILAGTHNNGLYLLNRNRNSQKKLGFKTQTVFFIDKYKDNKYFVCTGIGLYLVQLMNNSIAILDDMNSLVNTPTFYITQGEENEFWCATLEGLVRLSIKNDKIIFDTLLTTNTQPSLSTNNCRVLYYDKQKKELLIGTEGGGLNLMKFDAKNEVVGIDVYKKENDSLSLSNNYIRAIIKDSRENIWIGSYEGLNKVMYDSGTNEIKFHRYTKNDGLPNNMIQLIVEDQNHSLWIGTNGGLSKFIPDENKFINFYVLDGLQSNEFSEHSVSKNEDGIIVLGGINGINTFYPEEIVLSTLKPRITITDFFLFNKRISPGQKIGRNIPLKKSITKTDTIVLSPKNKNFSFRFSSLLFPNATKIQYAYMLEGFDNQWNYTSSNNRIASYTNLRHGDYVFKVKSTNTDGIWSEAPEELHINILTPFRYTWVAYIIYALILVLIFIYFSHFTVIRYATKRKLLLEKQHNEKLHELDEMRTKFFINISHDLRTPLTLISGPLNMILQEKNIAKNLKENLEIIKRNVSRLKYLVGQLLDFRKAETGKLHADLKSIDLVAFTKEELSHFTYAIENKGLQIRFTHSENKIVTCFDANMIAKVIFNVLSNAIKFTNRGEINIHIEKVNKNDNKLLKNEDYNAFVKVQITDTGIGIAKGKQARIFERFYQDQRHSSNGYGIGLSHSKELIDVHNGFIEAESEEGLGTRICFFLPLIEEIKVDENEIVTSTEDIYVDAEMEDELDENPVKRMTKTVLVVEDNRDMLAFIKKGLKGSYNVLLASDGAEGLNHALKNIPDLIVSDVMMPKMDGIELCKRIKSDIKVCHIPVILLTAKSDIETKYEGIETGADDFIPKPFEMEYLQIRIKNLLDTREQLRLIFQKENKLEPSAVTVTSIDEKFLKKLLVYIEKNLDDPKFSINSLESEMSMSHSSFYRKIKSLTGQSAQEVLQTMRMKRAHQILSENKGLRVSEVAYMVGFTDPKYFARCFKEMYGYIPSKTEKKKKE